MDLIILVLIGMASTVAFGIVLAGVFFTPWLVVLILGALLLALLKVPIPPHSHPIAGVLSDELEPWTTALAHKPNMRFDHQHFGEQADSRQADLNSTDATSPNDASVGYSPPSAHRSPQVAPQLDNGEPLLTYRGHVYHPHLEDQTAQHFAESMTHQGQIGHSWPSWHGWHHSVPG